MFQAINQLGTILSIWAHPDDETYLAGGTMAIARANGQRVVCAAATPGDRGTSDPDRWPPARLARVRRWEAAASMAVLGVDEHHVDGFPDGGLVDDHLDGQRWAGDLIDRSAADTILTFGPDGITFHPDHVAVHRWVTAAWRERGCRARLLYAARTVEQLERFGDIYESWNWYMTDDRLVGISDEQLALHTRLAGSALDRKTVALAAMATQTGDLIAGLGADVFRTLIADEPFVAATRPVSDYKATRACSTAASPSSTLPRAFAAAYAASPSRPRSRVASSLSITSSAPNT